jgi:hypothetical protein
MKPGYLTRSMLLALALGVFNATDAAQEDAADADAPPAVTDTQATESAQAPEAVTAPKVVSDPADTAATQPASDEDAAEQAMSDLLGSRQDAPVIEPVAEPSIQYPGVRIGVPAANVDIDPAVLGIAPGEDPPPLRREGEFVVNRRGRLIRSSDGGHLLFVFEADTQDAPELPMVLQACQLLEAMEDTVERHGDSAVFILSGQVHTYRGTNYLLPTMMKIAVDKGNLSN